MLANNEGYKFSTWKENEKPIIRERLNERWESSDKKERGMT